MPQWPRLTIIVERGVVIGMALDRGSWKAEISRDGYRAPIRFFGHTANVSAILAM